MTGVVACHLDQFQSEYHHRGEETSVVGRGKANEGSRTTVTIARNSRATSASAGTCVEGVYVAVVKVITGRREAINED